MGEKVMMRDEFLNGLMNTPPQRSIGPSQMARENVPDGLYWRDEQGIN
ncbi:MAG: hypothetical protein HOC91_01465 [Nitrospinaceae bacterium]|jgi:hypothetical protein|nr:hypothetical protein [Nitrospinaceae bacterium]MBT3433975.1 hypothetical protein [Nitrospinaceae bacterium]MBT3821819.1 hypothetical protein [Nitrospinaceae bacterium]MBT4093162.1 hypothetical protein [Nitrospinaceae bacterium]MBT4429163.1 hypothetical protein [Nitrospinaceae bacterium]